jgi:hypothetical protein
MANTVAPGWVRITCDDPAADLTLRLGPEPLKITGGLGGWEVTGRPRQVGMTTWAGVEPFQLTFSVMLDGWARRRSVESTLRKLVTIARGDDESEPGVIEVDGIPTPDRGMDWVVEAVEFGDPILRPTDASRVRQELTLTLREYVPPSYLRLAKRALDPAKRKTKVVTAHKGDTPAKIARRQHCDWRELRDLNPTLVRKANQTLKAHTKLRVPVARRRDRRHRR